MGKGRKNRYLISGFQLRILQSIVNRNKLHHASEIIDDILKTQCIGSSNNNLLHDVRELERVSK